MFSCQKIFLTIAVLVCGSVVAAGQTPDEKALELKTPIEREISGNQAHSFSIEAGRGDFIRVAVRQKNVDVGLTLYGPGGEKIYEVDNSNGREEPERISLIADADSRFRLDVRFVGKLSGHSAGKDYLIELETKRTPTAEDRARLKAERLYDRANLLRFSPEAESRRNSLEVFAESARLFSEAGDQTGEAFAYYALGQINSLLSNFADSRNNHEKAALIFRRIEDWPAYARAITDQASIHFFEEDLDRAEELCLEAMRVFQNLGDRRGEAEIIGNLGAIFDKRNQPRRALEQYLRALPLLQAEGDRRGESSVFSNIGSTYDDLGEPFAALENYEKALSIRRDLGDERTEAYTLANMSIVLKGLGQYERAIEASRRAFGIFERIGQVYGMAACLNILGGINDDLNDTEKALEYYEKSLGLNRRIKNKSGEAAILNNMATIKIKEGETEKALEFLSESLGIFSETGNRRDEGRVLVKIGETWLKKGDPEKALEYFERVLPLWKEVEDRSWEAETLFSMGEAFRLRRNPDKSREYFLRSLEIRRELKESQAESMSLFGLARAEKDSGSPVRAQERIEQAIGILEGLRSNISRRDLRNLFISSRQDFYEFYINLLIERHGREPKKGFDALAFEISERARARSLLESLGESRFDIRSGVSPELLERENHLRRIVNSKDSLRLSALAAKQTGKAADFEKELDGLIAEYREVQAKIRAENPRFAALTQPEVVSLKKIQNEILDQNTVLLEYFLGDRQSLLFVVTQDSLQTIKLPPRQEIKEAVRLFLENVRSPGRIDPGTGSGETERSLKTAPARLKKAREDLSRMILAPAGRWIAGNKRLLIVASGSLQYIPFAGLESSGAKSDRSAGERAVDPKNDPRFLIETNEVVVLPSVSVLAALREKRRSSAKGAAEMIAVVADPVFGIDDVRLKNATDKRAADKGNASGAESGLPRRLYSSFSRLRFSRREAETIAGLAPERQRLLALDFRANLETVRSESFKKARFVHFATHGIVNSELPELSGVVLSLVDENGQTRDGFLRLHDIYNLQLEADLVVLSACETALGKEIRGEGIVGLTRGFMYAGASDVVASLWKVDDRATADLMERFYRKMLKDKLPPADALRQAQISMIRDETFGHPFYWAGFVLQGDWRLPER
ncbi:MAG: CHAT domain-containing protein [Pyrinomonadaceae bacterium]